MATTGSSASLMSEVSCPPNVSGQKPNDRPYYSPVDIVVQSVPDDMTEYLKSKRPRSPPKFNETYRIDQSKVLGQGTHGHVMVAWNNVTGRRVILKKVKKEVIKNVPLNMPLPAYRELQFLSMLTYNWHSKYVVQLYNVCSSHEYEPSLWGRSVKDDASTGTAESNKTATEGKIAAFGSDITSTIKEGDVYMEMELFDHDLEGIRNGEKLDQIQIKYYMHGLMSALRECHKHNIIHRDVKEANVLISNNGIIKLADFGLACICPFQNRTNGKCARLLEKDMVTPGYKAPEILLGDDFYTTKIDIWAAGCVFVQLLWGKNLFSSDTEKDPQKAINEILQLCGTPSTKVGADSRVYWPQIIGLSLTSELIPANTASRQRKVQEFFRKEKFPEVAIDLIDWIFTWNPGQRPSANDVLKHRYFSGRDDSCPLISSAEYEKIYDSKYHKVHNQLRHQQKMKAAYNVDKHIRQFM